MPSASAFTSEGRLASCAEASAVAAHRGHIIVLIGNEDDRRKVANQLVALEFPRVAILDAYPEQLKARMAPPICLY